MKSLFFLLLLLSPGLMAADRDGDGVPDHKDACPDGPAGVVMANGCTPARSQPVVLHFDSDSARLRPEHYAQLKAFAQDSPQGRVRVVGHADSQGSEGHNRSLALRRARSVSSALSERYQIDGARIMVTTLGETLPWRDNFTPTGRALNRRVELWLEPGLILTSGEE
ncbi:OmpA family protein [Ferrimonas balearica]|uniref:OmpA family protein n=1 Tax=Ferrimonas balearica TaxID=44012 RepID=UPI001C997E20|nr:OmpA family protein [Ferrimonas balearica]MBY5992631.1 OmpA family protein [Ferrimonas balearica]